MFKPLLAITFSLTCTLSSAQLACAPSGPYGLSVGQQRQCDAQLAAQIAEQGKALAQKDKVNAKNSAAVAQCTAALTPASSAADLRGAIGCLAASPYAGQAQVSDFQQKNRQRIDALVAANEAPGLSDALAALVAKKRSLYWLVSSLDGRSQLLLVPESYQLGSDTGTVYDLSALDIHVVTTSRNFGSDEVMPLSQFRALSYSRSPHAGRDAQIGTVVVNDQSRDESYQAYYPLRHHVTAGGSKWSAVVDGHGIVYAASGQNVRKMVTSLNLSLKGLDGMRVELVDEATAQRFVDRVDSTLAAASKAREDAQTKAMAAYDAVKSKLASASKGDEDSCEGSDVDDGTVVKCQLLDGSARVKDIKTAGWIITNTSRVHNHYLITIRKAR